MRQPTDRSSFMTLMFLCVNKNRPNPSPVPRRDELIRRTQHDERKFRQMMIVNDKMSMSRLKKEQSRVWVHVSCTPIVFLVILLFCSNMDFIWPEFFFYLQKNLPRRVQYMYKNEIFHCSATYWPSTQKHAWRSRFVKHSGQPSS